MSRFPDPRYARSDVIAVGDDLRLETLRDAYRHGIFPWPHDDYPLPWFSPRRRTVLFFDELHAGRSLRKAQRQARWDFTVDMAFADVLRGCAESFRADQPGTWIGPEMVEAYQRFHDAGDVHSVEVWEGTALVGGLYGVDSGGVFTGESMFHRQDDASKLALLYLIERLRERGATWIDCQVMTPHMRALGAREISRAKFLDLMAETQARGIQLFSPVIVP